MGNVLEASTGGTIASFFSFTPDDECLWILYFLNPSTHLDSNLQSTFNAVAAMLDGTMVAVGSTSVHSADASAGNLDVIIANVNSEGYPVWTFTVGGSGDDEATAVVVLPNGNVIVGGFSDSYSGPGGGYDTLLIAVYNNGTIMWAITHGRPGADEKVFGLTLNSAGNVFAAGSTTVPSSTSDVLMFMLDPNGTVVWSQAFGGSGHDSVTAGLVAANGDGLFVVGSTNSSGAGGLDILLGKLDFSGNVIWMSTLGGPNNDAGTGIGLSVTQAGGVIVTGYFTSFSATGGSVGFGNADILLAKLDDNAGLTWALDVGGSQAVSSL